MKHVNGQTEISTLIRHLVDLYPRSIAVPASVSEMLEPKSNKNISQKAKPSQTKTKRKPSQAEATKNPKPSQKQKPTPKPTRNPKAQKPQN